MCCFNSASIWKLLPRRGKYRRKLPMISTPPMIDTAASKAISCATFHRGAPPPQIHSGLRRRDRRRLWTWGFNPNSSRSSLTVPEHVPRKLPERDHWGHHQLGCQAIRQSVRVAINGSRTKADRADFGDGSVPCGQYPVREGEEGGSGTDSDEDQLDFLCSRFS